MPTRRKRYTPPPVSRYIIQRREQNTAWRTVARFPSRESAVREAKSLTRRYPSSQFRVTLDR